MKMNTRIAIAALTALAIQAVCADVTSYSQDFESPDNGTVLPSDSLAGWSGDGTVTNTTGRKYLAVAGNVTYANASFTAGSEYQADFLVNFEEPSDELDPADSDLSEALIAVSVGTSFTESPESSGVYVAPIYVCTRQNDANAWVVTDAMVTSGQWARVSLLFDYANAKCRVSVNGVPAASSAGYATSSSAEGTGAWYPLLDTVSSSSSIANVSYSGIASVDDMVVTNGDVFAASSTPTPVTIEGANVSVPLSYLNKWGVSKSTIGVAASPDGTGMTIADKYLVGLEPNDGKCFEIKSVDMNSDGTQLQVKVSGAAPVENWYKIVLSSPAGAPLATLAYNGSAWKWTVGEAVSEVSTSPISSESGETTISVALPESIRGVSGKIKTEVVPVAAN